MAASPSLHILRRRDLKADTRYDAWDDPARIAPMSPQKVRALLDNPLAGDEDEPVQLLGTADNRVIGRLDLVPGVLSVGGRDERVHWGSEFFVAPASRHTFMGITLVMKSQAICRAVGASGPSQAALPLYQKLKYFDLPLPRYILLRRSRAVVEKYVGEGATAKVASFFADAALAGHRGLVAAWRAVRRRGLRAEPVEAAPPELDPLLSRRTEEVVSHRSAAWLNWLLTHSFRQDPRDRSSLHLVRDRAGEMVAYFLVKVRFHESATHRGFRNVLLGSLQDWMILDPSRMTMQDLLLLAVPVVVAAGADAVEVCTDDPAARTTLRLLGFARVGAMHMLVRGAPGTPLSRPDLHDPAKWWIRPGDGDSFFA